MGDRRMVSRKIVESARFLKMPATSQNLYFHLVVNADDDGIVEAYPVLALTKANEDDLRVLVSKQFVHLLNEDLVVYIEDWLEMNYFRADRKKDSRYKSLLLGQRPDVKLIEAKERSDTRRGKAKSQSKDSPRTAQPNLIQSKIIEPNLTEDKIINQSIYQETNRGIDEVTDIEHYKRIIAENIELDILYEMARRKDESEVAMVTEIFEIICDMVAIPRDRAVIKQTVYPWSIVKSQFLKLKRVHVENILNRIVDADLGIKNMASYLISSLYTESMSGTIREQAELHDDYLKYLRGNPYSI